MNDILIRINAYESEIQKIKEKTTQKCNYESDQVTRYGTKKFGISLAFCQLAPLS